MSSPAIGFDGSIPSLPLYKEAAKDHKMSAEIDLLQARPSCQKCLAWSEDGELAVAVGENVVILLPNRSTSSNGASNPWTQVRIKVNEFTHEEWPPIALASFKDMSLGEEQSNSHVIAVAWSPPGLALYRRPVLTVLTANHLLSFWAAEFDPREPDSWTRVLVVNNVIGMPHIRCMAWAPVGIPSRDDESNHPSNRWGPFVLAVAGDRPEVQIWIASYTCTTSKDEEWNLALCGQIECSKAEAVSPFPPSLLRQELEEYRYIDFVGFGPVKKTVSELRTTLRCRFSGVYTQATLTIAESNLQDASIQLIEGYHNESPRPFRDYESQFSELLSKYRGRHAKSHRTSSDLIDVEVHGSASFSSISAICVTSQVSNRIEYKTISDEVTTILFHDASTQDESLMFSWQTEPAVRSETAYIAIFAELKKTMLLSSTVDGSALKILYSAMMIAMVLAEPGHKELLQNAQSAATYLSEKLGCPSAFDKESRALSELNEKRSGNAPELSGYVRSFSRSRLPELLDDSRLAEVVDTCPIPSCGKPVSWEGVDESQCLGGHPLGSRCGITFLPILEPGISKGCLSCCREFLMDSQGRLGVEDKLGNGISDGTRGSLASHLLAIFDVCPYCGGKYYTIS